MGLSEIISSAPVIAQARQFSELAKNVTNTTDPINATFAATKLIAEVCCPPHVKYPLKCAVLAFQLGIVFSTGGLSSVTSVALGFGTAKQLLEELI